MARPAAAGTWRTRSRCARCAARPTANARPTTARRGAGPGPSGPAGNDGPLRPPRWGRPSRDPPSGGSAQVGSAQVGSAWWGFCPGRVRPDGCRLRLGSPRWGPPRCGPPPQPGGGPAEREPSGKGFGAQGQGHTGRRPRLCPPCSLEEETLCTRFRGAARTSGARDVQPR